MAEENGKYDWNARVNREEHARMNRNLEALRASMVEQKTNVDNLVNAIRLLIDRIPPENLR